MTPTPETLRKLAFKMWGMTAYVEEQELLAAASAWEAMERQMQAMAHAMRLGAQQLAASEQARQRAEKIVAAAKAFVDDGVPLESNDYGTSCACCNGDWHERREPPYDPDNPNAPCAWLDATEHKPDCVWVALVAALAPDDSGGATP